MKRRLILFLAALALLSRSPAVSAEFVEIEPAQGVMHVSANGWFVVGSTPLREGFIWSRQTRNLRLLEPLPQHTSSSATDVSADGSVVLGWSYSIAPDPPAEGFLWKETTGPVGLGYPTGFDGIGPPWELSADGSSAVGNAESPLGVWAAYRWTKDSGTESLGVPPGASNSDGRAISADGSVVVGASYEVAGGNSNNDAFIWDEESGFQGLGPLPDGWGKSLAQEISPDGSTVVGVGGPPGVILTELGYPFRWTRETGIRPFSTLPDTNRAWPNGVSQDGSIIVGMMALGEWETGPPFEPSQNERAFVWDKQHGTRDLRDVLIAEHGFTDAELPLLDRATDLSPDARAIVGYNEPFTRGGLNWAIFLDKPLVTFDLAGDYNNNGSVEQADLDLVLLNWGADATTPPAGWITNLPSGAVDQAELDVVLLNWGAAGTIGGATSTAVPEPATAVLYIIGLLVAVATGSRHSARITECT
jgi:uncharacterized membrane protein